MKIAYLDCSTGISGDMTLAALIDAGVDANRIRAGIDSLALEGVQLLTKTVIKGGFRSTYVRVEHPEQHAHRHLNDIVQLIDGADAIEPRQKQLAKEIFGHVARSEATVHGSTIDKVHFHEVGAVDSIVDIVGAAIAFDLLGADQIVSSAIPTGRGQIKIDHGVCTVPAPGTAELLRGIPLWDVPVQGELTTPTGAAIIKAMVDRFDALPEMTIESIGYGAGTMDLADRANLLRVFVGSACESSERDRVVIMETNLDDVSGEIIGHTKQRLLASGALDVYSTPIQMKKDRPGVILSVICRPANAAELEQIIFDETATLGIRRHTVERSKRSRQPHTVHTIWGDVKGKLGWKGGGQSSFTPEFDDCARVARENSVALREVYRSAEASFAVNSPTALPAADHSHDHDAGHTHDHDGGHSHDHDHGRDG